MLGISDTQRLLTLEQSLVGKHITVNPQGKIPCPLRMWHNRGDFLHFQVTPKTTGSYIPVQCKWCKASFYLSIDSDNHGNQIAVVQGADISKLPDKQRKDLLVSLQPIIS